MKNRNPYILLLLPVWAALLIACSTSVLFATSPEEETFTHRLEQLLRSHVLHGFERAELEAEVIAVHLPANLPLFGPEVRIEPQRTFIPEKAAGRFVVPVSVIGSDGKPVKLNPTVETVAIIHGWAPRLPMQRGDLIEPDAFETKTIRVAGREENYFTGDGFPTGYQLATNLAQGQLLMAHQLEQVPAVESGETVMIYYRRNGITLVSPGQVRRQGMVGDLLPVISRVTGKRLQGRLEAPGIIVVE
ncbi:flagellar basal body P-ring formation chaperone FlgA [Candidatus Neomarinimicrobiota bacterium]